MRCGCPSCGAYMAQSEGLEMGCVCPQCGTRCKDCLGTNSVISRETLRSLKQVSWISPSFDSDVPSDDRLPADDPFDPSERG